MRAMQHKFVSSLLILSLGTSLAFATEASNGFNIRSFFGIDTTTGKAASTANITAEDMRDVVVTWQEVTGADSYRLEYRTADSEQWLFEDAPDTTLSLSLAIGDYQFRTIACIQGDESSADPLCDEVADYSEIVDYAVSPYTAPIAVPDSPSFVWTSSMSPSAISAEEDRVSTQVSVLPGQFRVSESGAATYTVPIRVPEGFGGTAPDLGLTYNSTSGNGPLGVGWNISGYSEIGRCRHVYEEDHELGAIDLDVEDALCMNGQRMVATKTPDQNDDYHGLDGAIYRTKVDNMVRVTGIGDSVNTDSSFTAEHVDGSTHTYSRTVTAGDNDVPYRWLLTDITDNLNNRIQFNYNEADNITGTLGDNEVVLTSVTYSGNRVDYFYDTNRSDIQSGYILGQMQEMRVKLNRIDVRNHLDDGNEKHLLQSYLLSYKSVTNSSKRQRLSSIRQCADTSGDLCLPATTFDWSDTNGGVQATSNIGIDLSRSSGDYAGFKPLDFNGDGLIDVGVARLDDETANVRFYSNQGGYFSYQGQITFDAPRKVADSERVLVWYPVDLNGDNKQEVLYLKENTNGTNSWQLYSQGNVLSTDDITGFGLLNADSDDRLDVIDVDADGWQDIIINRTQRNANDNEIVTGHDLLRNVRGALTRHNLYVRHKAFTAPDSACFRNKTPAGITVARLNFDEQPPIDINGDGAPDALLTVAHRVRYTGPKSNCGGQTEDTQEFRRFAGYSLEEDGDDYIFREAFPINDASSRILSTVDTISQNFVGDINGDGLTDIVYRKDTRAQIGGGEVTWSCSQSDGRSMQRLEQCGLSNVPDDAKGFTLKDYNGDGKTDLLYNNNNRWFVRYAQDDRFGGSRSILNASNAHLGNTDIPIWLDLDGDSYSDYLRIDTENKQVHITRDNVATFPGIAPVPRDHIERITNGFGLITEIDYAPLSDADVYTRGTGAHEIDDWGNGSRVIDLSHSGYLVKAARSSAPGYVNGSYDADKMLSVQYHYHGLRVQAGGRGSLGFATVYSYDPDRDVTTQTQYHQDYPLLGRPYSTTRYLGTRHQAREDRSLLSAATNNYGVHALMGGVILYPYLDDSSETQYALNDAGTATQAIATTVTDNTYSVSNYQTSENHVNLTQTIVTTRQGITGALAKRVTTVNQYTDEKPQNWWLGRVTRTEVTHERLAGLASIDRENTKVRVSEFTYDPTHGMLSLETVAPEQGAALELQTLHCYNTYGDKIKEITSSNHLTLSCDTGDVDVTNNTQQVLRIKEYTYNADADDRYIDSNQDAKFTRSEVNARNLRGQPTLTTDINGIKTRYAYDSFGLKYGHSNNMGQRNRITRRLASDASGSFLDLPEIDEAYHYVKQVTSVGRPTRYTFIDKIGRTVATATQGFDGRYIIQSTSYNPYGEVVKASRPHYAGDAAYYTLSEYDQFNRLQRITAPDANTPADNSNLEDGTRSYITYSANGLSTTTRVVADYNGLTIDQSNTETNNVIGEKVAVTDAHGETTSFFFNATGELVRVVGVDDVAINTFYDDYGRKTAMHDPNKGNWNYSYNALGELVSQESARGHYTVFFRDSVGRRVSRQVFASNESSTPIETTKYDFANSHQLDSECFQTATGACDTRKASKTFHYDSLGRLVETRTSLPIPGGTPEIYSQSTQFDIYGRVFQTFDGLGDFYGVRNRYNDYGYITHQEEARYSAGNSEQRQIYSHIQAMDAYGNVTRFQQQNGIVNTRTYNPQTGYATSHQAKVGSLLLQDNDISFDPIGNLRSRIRKTLNSGTVYGVNSAQRTINSERFAYDNLNRLTNINDTEEVTQYYANGNIRSRTGIGNYCYHDSRPHAVSDIGSDGCSTQTYEYDANGNMQEGRGRTIVYGHYDKPTSISNSAGETHFAYDTGRNRYQRTSTEQNSEGVEETLRTFYLGNLELVYQLQEDGNYRFKETKRYLPDAIQSQNEYGQPQTRYLHKDHLGSIDSITNSDGLLVTKLYFDAWGARKSVTQASWVAAIRNHSAITLESVLNITTRGFTGHEHVRHANIIHMNGRIYDPALGRFLQSDPFIQAPENSQSYNRYAYVLNNPLSHTDPSGFFFKKLLRSIAKIPILNAAISLVLAIYCQVCLVAYNAATTYAVTGSLKAAFTSGLVAAITPGGGNWGSILASAVIGGLASKVQGGNFGHGFWSAGIGAALGGRIKLGNPVVNVLAAAIVGGTVSKLTGGKFANGAQTWAFNAAVAQDWGGKNTGKEQGDGAGDEPDHITDKVVADDRFDLKVSDDGKTLTGEIKIYCGNVDPQACQGVANSMEQINQTTNGLTIDLTVTTTDYAVLADIDVRWYNFTGRRIGDSQRLNGLKGLIGAHNKVRLKNGLGYGARVDSLTPAHELGHAIGLGHQANSTNSLMSYSATKTNALTDVQIQNLFKAYSD